MSLSTNWQQEIISESKKFVRFASRKLGNEELAADLFQDSFLKALKCQNPPESEKIENWFYKIMSNAIIDTYRKRASERRFTEKYGLDPTNQSRQLAGGV